MTATYRNGLAVIEEGSGPAVLMVHGLGGTSSVWEPQAMRLRERFRVVRFDMRGSGRSPADGPLSVGGWVDDLVGLMESLDIARAHLVGHSLGTLVVQHVAAQMPARVASMSLLGINRSPPEARRAAIRKRADDVRRDGVVSIVDGLIANATSAHSRQHSMAAMATIRELLSRQDDRGYAWSCEASAESVPADLSQVTAPLLLVAGSADTVSPPQAARELALEKPGTRVVELADCGHWMPLEQPEAVNSALDDFLSAVERPGDRP